MVIDRSFVIRTRVTNFPSLPYCVGVKFDYFPFTVAIFSLKENSVRHVYLNFTRVPTFLSNIAWPEC